MKNLSILARLQTQYNKLTQLLQTKGNQFSQFKYQQILNRISRCGLQMKRLGMGMGVCLALGVGTPVVGQYVPPAFLEHDGISNPLESILVDLPGSMSGKLDRPAFVDIDNDGDYDMFLCQYFYNGTTGFGSRTISYYENIGSPTVASFIERTGTANPLNNVKQFKSLEFVDIDGDGDFDLFVSGYGDAFSYNPTPICVYFRNTGTATTPNFVQQSSNNNPLDSVNIHLTGNVEFYTSFVDIDNDGDLDCFGGVLNKTNQSREYWYYRNQGNFLTPIFRKQSTHPLTALSAVLPTSSYWWMYKPEFHDMDGDGDKDLFALSFPVNEYFENTGSINAPIFLTTTPTTTPLDSIKAVDPYAKGVSIVDIDADGDLDVFTLTTNSTNGKFYENLDTTIVSNINFVTNETSILIYPNPTTGILNFEKATTGTLSLYNITGQKIWGKELYEAQEVNLSELTNGIYFLEIETAKDRSRNKIVIQK